MSEGISSALHVISDITVFSYFVLGCTIGFVFGIIPGLGSTLGLALVLPFTIYLEPLCAIYMYAGLIGTMSFGGSIPAILMRVPGTGINVASTFDGYPMTQKGESKRALSIAAVSSFFGAAFGLIFLILMLPIVKIVARL